MHITLISPPMVTNEDTYFYIGRRGGPPLNIAYLARIIDNCNVEYDIIDCLGYDDKNGPIPWKKFFISGLSIDDTVSKINDKTQIVGITAMFTSEWVIVRELAKRIKQKFPNILLIVGGEHATADTDNIMTYDTAIDICFLGESEDSFEFFIKNFSNHDYLKTPGIAYRNAQGQIIKNPRNKRKKNLDNLLPLWDKIDVNFYTDRKFSHSRIGKRAMPLLTTRGCPYKCTFCTNEQMWGQTYITRSVESIIYEMKYNIEKYNINHFDLLDLAVSINRRWFIELNQAIISQLPNITWEATVGTRSEILDQQVLELLKKSGSTTIGVAPEAGSETMIKKVKKNLNFNNFFQTIDAAVKIKLDIKANIIIGLPDETIVEFLSTLLLVCKLGWRGVKGISIFTFIPFPGSAVAKNYFEPIYKTEVEYEQYVESQAGLGIANVFNIKDIFSHPKKQFYAFVSNSMMLFSYFLSMLRRPQYFYQLFRNLKNKEPITSVEVALYFYLKRLKILR